MEKLNKTEQLDHDTGERQLIAKVLKTDTLPKPAFVGGNLCDPMEVLTSEERAAEDLTLSFLANARSRDSQQMPRVVVD